MVRKLLKATDTDSATEFLAKGDKILYGASETNDGKMLVAGALDATNEQQYDMLVTGCRVSHLEYMHNDTKPHIIFEHVAVGGAVKLVAANLGHILWTKNISATDAATLRYQIDQNRNVLLQYGASGASTRKFAYLDGTDGSLIGEFAITDVQTSVILPGGAGTDVVGVDRETYLTGWDAAWAISGGQAVSSGGYLWTASPGWGAGFEAGAPDYIKFPGGMWANTPAFTGVGSGGHSVPFMTSTGWMALVSETFYWRKTRTADGEIHNCAIQYAIVSEGGAAPSVVVTYLKVTQSTYVDSGSGPVYTHTLVTETGTQITRDTAQDHSGDDYPVLNVVSALGEVWLYGNTVLNDFRNYHRVWNDGTLNGSVTNTISESDTHKASFTDESRYLLVGPTHGDYDTIYDTDGNEVSGSIGGSDTLINCYVLEDTDEYIQVDPATPDTGSNTTYHHLWEVSGSAVVARVIAGAGGSVWNHAAMVDIDYHGSYLGNGFGLGKSYDQGTHYLFKVDDLVAGFSVIYFTVTLTISDSGTDYVFTGDLTTRRPAWIDPAVP